MIKRKILFSAICLIMFIAFCIFITIAVLNMEISTTSSNTKIIPPIIIDAGHGGEDGGAVNEDGILEKDINLLISNDTYDFFKLLGFNVTKTRNGDYSLSSNGNTVHSRKVNDMKKRLEIYNSDSNNVIISIHQNKFSQSKYSGTQIFYSKNNMQSKLLADNIRLSVKKQLQPDNKRECKMADNGIYLLKNTNNTAIIAECGFISNKNECKKLLTSKYQKQISYAIVTGFLDYYNSN